MHINVKNNPAKFILDPIWNDGALGLSWRVLPQQAQEQQDGLKYKFTETTSAKLTSGCFAVFNMKTETWKPFSSHSDIWDILMFRSCSEIPAFTFTVFCRVRDCFSFFLLSVDETGGGGRDDDDVLTVFISRMLCRSRNRTKSGAQFRMSDFEHFKSDLHKMHTKTQ